MALSVVAGGIYHARDTVEWDAEAELVAALEAELEKELTMREG